MWDLEVKVFDFLCRRLNKIEGSRHDLRTNRRIMQYGAAILQLYTTYTFNSICQVSIVSRGTPFIHLIVKAFLVERELKVTLFQRVHL